MKKQLFLLVLLSTGLQYCQDNQKPSAEDFFVNFFVRIETSDEWTLGSESRLADVLEIAVQDFFAKGGDLNEKIYGHSLAQKLKLTNLCLGEDDLNTFRSLQVSSLIGLLLIVDLDEAVGILASKGAKTILADIVNIAQVNSDSEQIMTAIKFLN